MSRVETAAYSIEILPDQQQPQQPPRPQQVPRPQQHPRPQQRPQQPPQQQPSFQQKPRQPKRTKSPMRDEILLKRNRVSDSEGANSSGDELPPVAATAEEGSAKMANLPDSDPDPDSDSTTMAFVGNEIDRTDVVLDSASPDNKGPMAELSWGQLVYEIDGTAMLTVRSKRDESESRAINFLCPTSEDLVWFAKQSDSTSSQFDAKLNLRPLLKIIFPRTAHEYDCKLQRLNYYQVGKARPVDYLGPTNRNLTGTLVLWSHSEFKGGEFQFDVDCVGGPSSKQLNKKRYTYHIEHEPGYGRRLNYVYYPRRCLQIMLPVTAGGRLALVCRIMKRASHSKPREPVCPDAQEPECIEKGTLIYSSATVPKDLEMEQKPQPQQQPLPPQAHY